MKEFDELFELLTMLNRFEEAAFLEYQIKLEQHKEGKFLADALKSMLKIHFESQKELKFEAHVIGEQVRLLENQVTIVAEDKKRKLQNDNKLKVGDTLSQTLWYTCINHWDDKDDIMVYGVPKKYHKISMFVHTRQFVTFFHNKPGF